MRESREWLTTYIDGTGREIEEQKDVMGSFGVSFAGERDSVSPFLELSLPLHEIWNVGLAGRYSNHDDVGSTAAGQLETVFELSPDFSLRGNWSMGNRAPYLGGLHTARVTSVPRIYDYATGQRYQVEAVNFGNPDLEPDRAESYGAGFVTKLGPVSASADWYWTKLSRLLTVVTAQVIVDYRHDNEGALPPGVTVFPCKAESNALKSQSSATVRSTSRASMPTPTRLGNGIGPISTSTPAGRMCRTTSGAPSTSWGRTTSPATASMSR